MPMESHMEYQLFGNFGNWQFDNFGNFGNFAPYITICEISAVEMCMTLTLTYTTSQCQI